MVPAGPFKERTMRTCRRCGETKDESQFYAVKARPGSFYSRCRTCNNQIVAQWERDNKERKAARTAEYRAKPEARKRAVEVTIAYHKRNPHKKQAQTVARRLAKEQRTPKWLTAEHKAQMAEVYNLARECRILTGDAYHVDHVVPLNGEFVSGLHVPWNLQVLPSDVNIAKSNRI